MLYWEKRSYNQQNKRKHTKFHGSIYEAGLFKALGRLAFQLKIFLPAKLLKIHNGTARKCQQVKPE